jgi:hypothetical protein
VQNEKQLGKKYLTNDKDFQNDHGSMLEDINNKMQKETDIKNWMEDAEKRYSQDKN